MQTSLISVCIPVRNGAGTLEETLASVLAQEAPGFELEVVISDNMSDDGTAGIVAPFLADPRVRYVPTTHPLSLFENFDRAVRLSRGAALMALGADDVLRPGCLAALASALGDGDDGPVLAGCSVRVVDANGRSSRLRLRPRPLGAVAGARVRRRMLWTGVNAIATPSAVLIRRTAFDRVGGFRGDAGYAGDLDLWLRLAAVGDLRLLDEELVEYRIHAASETARRGRDQVRSVLDALARADRQESMRALRLPIRAVVTCGRWLLRRLAVRFLVRGLRGAPDR